MKHPKLIFNDCNHDPFDLQRLEIPWYYMNKYNAFTNQLNFKLKYALRSHSSHITYILCRFLLNTIITGNSNQCSAGATFRGVTHRAYRACYPSRPCSYSRIWYVFAVSNSHTPADHAGCYASSPNLTFHLLQTTSTQSSSHSSLAVFNPYSSPPNSAHLGIVLSWLRFTYYSSRRSCPTV